MRKELDARQRRLSGKLGAQTHHDGNQRHENRQQDGGQETGNDTQNDLGDLEDPRQPRELDGQLVDVADGTDKGDGNGPEDDHGRDEGDDDIAADHSLPPRNRERLPDNLAGTDADGPRRHLEPLVVGEDLGGALGIGLGAELDKDTGNLLEAAGAVLGLNVLGGGDETLELGAAPVDRVHLVADEPQRAEAMRGALLEGNPAGRNASRFGVEGRRRAGFVGRPALGDGGLAGLVREPDELDLGLFQAHGDLVALLHHLVDGLGVARDPDVLDRRAKDLAKPGLVEIVVRDRREEDGARRDAVGVKGAHEEGLAEVDEEDDLAHDEVHDEAKEGPGGEGVGVVAVSLRVAVDVAIGQDVELLAAVAARGVDGEQDGPGDAAADEAEGAGDAHEAEVEVGVERLVLESVDIGDLPKGAEPVEEAAGQGGRAFVFSQAPEVGSGRVVAAVGLAEDQEDGDVDGRDDENGHQG